MTAQTPAYLKTRFENNDIPQGTDYEDVFDSYVNIVATAEQSMAGNLRTTGQFVGNVSANSIFGTTVSAEVVFTSALKANIVSANTFNASLFQVITVSAASLFASNANITTVSAQNVNATNVSAVSIFGTNANIATVSANTVNTATVSAVSIFSTNANIATVSANIINAVSVTAGTSYIVSADTLRTIEVSAVATTQAGALLVEAPLTFVTFASNNDNSVRLPLSVRGVRQTIVNATTTILKIFPAVSGRFVVTAVNASLTIQADRVATIYHQGNERYAIQIG